MDREQILAEVRRTAAQNDGKPLGRQRFESQTGITKNEWLRYWALFTDMQREAGFKPNKLSSAYEDTYLYEKLIGLTREVRRFPSGDQIRWKGLNDSTFPSHMAFARLGNKNQLLVKLAYYSRKNDYTDILELIEPLIKNEVALDTNHEIQSKYGFVYLVKGHPGEYKIGRTNLIDRRLSELGATASIEQELIHEIKTDDPSGIESYWHKRFASKRMRGEWFKLTPEDVKTFKRWKRIF